MLEAVHILCAVRNAEAVRCLSREMDDGEHCLFEIVSSGTQALKSCRNCLPDILVIDAVLPGIDGLGVVDMLRGKLDCCMPRVIGGAAAPLSEEGFHRRGAAAVVHVPWQATELRGALLEQIKSLEDEIDWRAYEKNAELVGILLMEMGMNCRLKGFFYLCWAAALVCGSEGRLCAVSSRVYDPIARHFGTTPQNVERLIRHAVESTMNAARAKGVYSLFGNTIDPSKGKPTNAQIIALLAQRMRVEKNKAL